MSVVYYFGAGASAYALPMINQIPTRLSEFLNFLENLKVPMSEIDDDIINKLSTTPSQVIDDLKKDIKWLLEESKNHSTIDTFAKKLFITENEDIKKLKSSFACFFLFQQAQYGFDYRYDTFYASLLQNSNNGVSLPKNLKVITWNYDSQFEMALGKYFPSFSIEAIRTKLNSIPIPGKKIIINENEFSLIRLNGIAGAYEDAGIIYRASETILNTKKDFFSTTLSKESIQAFKNIIINYAITNKFGVNPYLQFSWDNHETTNEIKKQIYSSCKNTETLVVIGYSFPFFNRKIDREVINSMEKLKKIYMQFPDDFVHDATLRIEALLNKDKNIQIVPITDIKEFYIPNEYD